MTYQTTRYKIPKGTQVWLGTHSGDLPFTTEREVTFDLTDMIPDVYKDWPTEYKFRLPDNDKHALTLIVHRDDTIRAHEIQNS